MTEPSGELSGHRVLLTGATGGIGRAVAARLARGGAELALVGRRGAILEEMAKGLGALAVAGDLADEAFVERLPPRVLEAWGAEPDILINNAGVFELVPFASSELATFEQHLAVNLRAPFHLIRMWLPGMVERRAGQIINIGSLAGRKAFHGNTAYSASKFGLRGLHEVLVEEVRGTGVRVTWIEPSAVDTPLWDKLDPDSRDDLPSREEMLGPEAVADAVYFAVTRQDNVAIEEIVIRPNRVGR